MDGEHYHGIEDHIDFIRQEFQNPRLAGKRDDEWQVPAAPGFKGQLWCLDMRTTEHDARKSMRTILIAERGNGWIPHQLISGLPAYSMVSKSGEIKLVQNPRGNLVVAMFRHEDTPVPAPDGAGAVSKES